MIHVLHTLDFLEFLNLFTDLTLDFDDEADVFHYLQSVVPGGV